ncbi:MAG: MEKHLA domain-containing protein [Cyanobacteriota bacterium]|nr:MEKHLA domain-containing protein [Cyanobacteriota bacterium]
MTPTVTAPWLSDAAIGIAQRILYSHQVMFGSALIAPLPADSTPLQRAQALFASDRVVMAHDGTDPGGAPGPRLIYANRAGLRLWERPWTEMIGMPSRLTAEPQERAGRARMLATARQQRACEGYSGVRISRSGRRFQIANARLWTLRGPDEQSGGQAATFSNWWWL